MGACGLQRNSTAAHSRDLFLLCQSCGCGAEVIPSKLGEPWIAPCKGVSSTCGASDTRSEIRLLYRTLSLGSLSLCGTGLEGQ